MTYNCKGSCRGGCRWATSGIWRLRNQTQHISGSSEGRAWGVQIREPRALELKSLLSLTNDVHWAAQSVNMLTWLKWLSLKLDFLEQVVCHRHDLLIWDEWSLPGGITCSPLSQVEELSVWDSSWILRLARCHVEVGLWAIWLSWRRPLKRG